MDANDATGLARPGTRQAGWPVDALLVVGGWLLVSPLVLSTTRVTAGVVSAVTTGVALIVLASWARMARNPIPPLAIACAFGLWLLAVPSMWEFSYGVDSEPGLVPVVPWDVTEPARAVVARAEWNSILAGLVILLMAGSALWAARRREGRPAPAAGDRRRPPAVTGERR
jgi:hypothetical protein